MSEPTKEAPIRKLSSYREFEHEVPLAKELPYWDFKDNLVILADGSLAVGYRLKGVANETWDADQINHFTVGLRSFLNALPDSCEITLCSETNSDCSELITLHDGLKGSNPLLSWIADSRTAALKSDVESYQLLKSNLYLVVYSRFKRSESGSLSFVRSFFSTPKLFNDEAKKHHDTIEGELSQVAENIRTRLEAIGIQASGLDGQAVLKLVYRFFNPERSTTTDSPKINRQFESQEFTKSELEKAPSLSEPGVREQLVFSDLVQGYRSFLLDGWYHRCVTLKTLPEFTYSALISRLSSLAFPHMVHLHIRVPEQSKELSSLQAKRRVAHSMSASHGGKASDLESEAKLQSTEELLKELINTGQKIFYFQLTILLREQSEEELERRTKTVLSTFRELNGAEGLAETVANLKVWKTLLPFGNTQAVRNKRAKTDNLADVLPVYQPQEGPDPAVSPPVCLFRNRNGGLLSYNPFNPTFPNFNSLVTGSSGAGKSFLNNLVLLQYATQNPLIYIIDIGGSYRKLCDFLGGQYIDMQPPQSHDDTIKAINPFVLPSGTTEPAPQKIKFLIALLENILTDKEGDRLSKLDKSLLEEAILKLYPDILQKHGRVPTLTDLLAVMTASEEPQLRNFGKMLYPWTGDRPYGRLLDADNKLELSSDFVVFDLKGLSSYPDLQSAMILIITDFILTKVESKEERYRGRRRQILLDECWELLKSPASANFMEYCVRTLRKTGSGITFITQGLEEIVASPIGSAILSNTATKFILLQRGDLEPIRKILKLNEQEMALISSLRQEKGKYSEAFLMANEMRGVIRACPTPIEYWLATSDATDNALLEDKRKECPNLSLPQVIHLFAQEYPRGAAGGKAA